MAFFSGEFFRLNFYFKYYGSQFNFHRGVWILLTGYLKFIVAAVQTTSISSRIAQLSNFYTQNAKVSVQHMWRNQVC